MIIKINKLKWKLRGKYFTEYDVFISARGVLQYLMKDEIEGKNQEYHYFPQE